jgi:hypothetical protein
MEVRLRFCSRVSHFAAVHLFQFPDHSIRDKYKDLLAALINQYRLHQGSVSRATTPPGSFVSLYKV